MSNPTIEASDTGKGFRLQRLRALELLLEAIISNPNAKVYCAVEYDGDVRLELDGHVRIEEAKNYGSAKSFSLVNALVLHAVAQFLYLYLENREGPELNFGFYTNVAIGAEKQVGIAKNLEIDLPNRPIIELLNERDYDYPHLLTAARTLITAQFKKERGSDSHYVERLAKWDDSRWIAFLRRLSWHFGEPDEEGLYRHVCNLIPRHPRFSTSHRGKEDFIVARLLDLIDCKQKLPPLDKFISRDTVDVVFLEAASVSTKPLDPLWIEWERAQTSHTIWNGPSRGVREKFTDYLGAHAHEDSSLTPEILVANWVDYAASGHLEWQATDMDRNMQGLRMRVLQVCRQELRYHAHAGDTNTLDAKLSWLTHKALQEIQEYARSHDYLYSGESAIRKVIAALLDKCFIDVGNHD